MDRIVEERLARAAADGELDAPTLAGKPIADLGESRNDLFDQEDVLRRWRGLAGRH